MEGLTPAEKAKIDKGVTEAVTLLKKWGVWGVMKMNDSDATCLNCGRVVFCGPPCCDNPRYEDPREDKPVSGAY